MRLRYLSLTLILSLPLFSHAAVSVSEIAWMGDADSANHEWVELQNAGETAVSIEGWTLTDGNNLTVELVGTVPAGAYVLLERNRSDESYHVEPPFLTYAGALVNSGATLTLRDAAGSIIDQVVGGEDWEAIGGSNDTKATAQYSGSAWVTAAPTPGAKNADRSDEAETDTTASTTSSQVTSTRTGSREVRFRPDDTGSIQLTMPDESLDLTIRAPEVTYVGQLVRLTAAPSGVSSQPVVESLKYRWNFGDMHTGAGPETEHRYIHPGEYVVTVHAAYARHEQVGRHTIVVLPTNLSLSRTSDGHVRIHNDGPREIRLDDYELAGFDQVTIPDRTILLPRATVVVPGDMVGRDSAAIALADATGRYVAFAGGRPGLSPTLDAPEPFPLLAGAMATKVAAKPNTTPAAPSPASPASDPSFRFLSDASTRESVATTSAATPIAEATTAAAIRQATTLGAIPESGVTTRHWSELGMLVFIVLGILALYISGIRRTYIATPTAQN